MTADRPADILRFKKCVIYARVSTEAQVQKGSGLHRQFDELVAFANATRMHIVGVFCDVCSGELSVRPALAGALKAAQKADYFLVEAQDRLARSYEAYQNISQYLDEYGVSVLYYYDQLPREIPKTPDYQSFRATIE